jgi:hypothetical protein
MKFLLPFLVIYTLFLQACNPAYQAARKYVKSAKNEVVVVIPPTFLYRNNIDADDSIGLSGFDRSTRDSLIYERSTFLKIVNDSLFLTEFTNSFLDELKKYGLTVCLIQSPDQPLQSCWKVNLVQLQMEEDQKVHNPFEYESGYGINSRFEKLNRKYSRFLNYIHLNSWIEVQPILPVEDIKNTLYNTQTQTDNFKGGFQLQFYKNKPTLIPLVKLTLDDIYRMAVMGGKEAALTLFNYLINNYVSRRFPSQPQITYSLHHYRVKKLVTPRDDWFKPMFNDGFGSIERY